MATRIAVSSQAVLVPKHTRKGVTTIAEVYANWETGNHFTVPANSDEQTIVEAYREALTRNFK